jgi:hypothetical protein
MADKQKDAFIKGRDDYNKSGGQANSNPLTELFHPSYNPPSGYEKQYKDGWDTAEYEKSKN